MVYKANVEKVELFKKFSFKQSINHTLPMYLFSLILSDFFMFYVLFFSCKLSLSFSLFTILGADLTFFVVYFLSYLIVINRLAKSFDKWEIIIEENYAVLVNPQAKTTVYFADIKRFKKNEDSIVFYLGGIKRFFINWNIFNDSESLRKQLENVSEKIGTFEKPEKESKTNAKFKFSNKMRIIYLAFILVIVALIIISK